MAILSHLDKNNPLDAAIVACITTTFWSVSRLGEFTVETISHFNRKKHITTRRTSLDCDCNRHQVRTFNLPFTKMDKENGESTSWAKQLGPTNPWQALKNHQCINAPLPDTHIFAYIRKIQNFLS